MVLRFILAPRLVSVEYTTDIEAKGLVCGEKFQQLYAMNLRAIGNTSKQTGHN